MKMIAHTRDGRTAVQIESSEIVVSETGDALELIGQVSFVADLDAALALI